MSDLLRNKILQWEASPPPEAWKKITMHLEEINAENNLARRIRDMESLPPTGAWKAISQQLHIEPPAKSASPVIPIRPLYPYLFRYGAVAIVAGFLAWIFIDNPFDYGEKKISTAIIPAKPANPVYNESFADEPAKNGPSPILSSEGIASTREINKLPVSRKREPVYAVVHNNKIPLKGSFPNASTASYTVPPSLQLMELPVQKRNPRYITIASQTGEPVKLSAKFASAYSSLFNGSQEQYNTQAADLIKQLQLQISKRSYVPDPANLFDMVMLGNMLQEEQ
ncbi:hypothetical protein [Flavihumibacter profundi]|jgi:hypothetical protein|uniref:hypothetical protein n=1 Tax=Flavihumibacter profundi TaxID=2716883 RepID=UPI001CC7A784|nr:hypothetical protein [Flavihumibacter profundi]MBZ5855660.1 hypothetical protein [Flavihumibacter profundi]